MTISAADSGRVEASGPVLADRAAAIVDAVQRLEAR